MNITVKPGQLTFNSESQLTNYKGKPFTGIEKDHFSRETAYYKNGILHREDGPALVECDGSLEWYQHGQLHRVNGPAVEDVDGTKEWWQYGQLHRIDGPAIEHPDDYTEWAFNGCIYKTMDEWAEEVGIFDTDDFTMLKLKWG